MTTKGEVYFSPYEKMATSFKKVDTKVLSKLEKRKWVVTEKVHGANFSIIYQHDNTDNHFNEDVQQNDEEYEDFNNNNRNLTNSNLLQFAKRRGILQWTDNFFGYQSVVTRLEGPIMRLMEDLVYNFCTDTTTGTINNQTMKNSNKSCCFITYGELFGGKYPHPKVTSSREDEFEAIQTGVYYTPDINFCAFDIAMISNNNNDTNEKYYMAYETAEKYFIRHGIFYAKPLIIGKLTKALDFPTRVTSTIPKCFDLPPLTGTYKSNIMEGVVIKPYNHGSTSSGGGTSTKDDDVFVPANKRPIIKIKNKEFDEEEMYHQSQAWTYDMDRAGTMMTSLSCQSSKIGTLVHTLKRYVTRNRLQSAISKIGPLTKHSEEDIQNEVWNDIVEDHEHQQQQQQQQQQQNEQQDDNDGNDDDFKDDASWRLSENLTTKEYTWVEERIKASIKILIRTYSQKK